MRSATIPVLLAATLVAGCGVPRYGTPPVTLQDREAYFGLEVGWDAARVANGQGLSLAGFAWWGVGDTDAVGLGFRHTAVFLPSLSYAHYGRTGSDDLRWLATAHADLVARRAGPVAEITLGGTYERGAAAHAVAAGAALLAWPGTDAQLVPAVRYIGQQGEARWELGAYPGRTRRALANLKGRYLSIDDAVVIEVARADIAEVAVERVADGAGRRFTLRDGRILRVLPGDPWADCYSCGFATGWMNRFVSAPGRRVWWIEWEEKLHIYELDMEAVLVGLERDGVLRLAQDPDVVAQTLDRYDEWWRDLTAGAGWFWRQDP